VLEDVFVCGLPRVGGDAPSAAAVAAPIKKMVRGLPSLGEVWMIGVFRAMSRGNERASGFGGEMGG